MHRFLFNQIVFISSKAMKRNMELDPCEIVKRVRIEDATEESKTSYFIFVYYHILQSKPAHPYKLRLLLIKGVFIVR